MNTWKGKYQTRYRMRKLYQVLYTCKIVKKPLENRGRGEEECSNKCRNCYGGGCNQFLGIKSSAETVELIAAAVPVSVLSV